MLRELLMADPDSLKYNYRAKVERLQLEVSQTAAYTLTGHGLLDLHGMVYNCPRLLDLELYHQKDMSPYRSLDDPIKWTYPESMFDALNNNVTGTHTILSSWRWSSRLAGKKWPIENLRTIHESPSFRGLRKIAFVNYQKALPRKNVDDPQHEKLLAESLSVLNLDHLIFESSTLANAILLPLLPTQLKHLELINCWEIVSEDLAEFLMSHGSQLLTLTLNHNQSLSLSFLTVLADACPKLETLKMNLTYYNVHSSYHDSEPQYDKLLGVNEIPTWPSSLQNIELTQLRNWDIDTATAFFQSLLSHAGSLVDLRRLVIKAIINTSWRERSTFRDEWVGTFDRVFKRKSPPPNPHLRSIGAYDAYKKQSQKIMDLDPVEVVISPLKSNAMSPDTKAILQSSTKISSSLQDGQTPETASDLSTLGIPQTGAESSHDQDPGASQHQSPPKRRSTRVVPTKPSTPPPSSKAIDGQTRREVNRKRVISRELAVLQQTAGFHGSHQDNSDSDSARDDDSDDEPLIRQLQRAKEKQKEVIQGMCDVVSITIDNLRPTENQFVEADFLDSEPEGDEDWDGSEEAAGDRYYAW